MNAVPRPPSALLPPSSAAPLGVPNSDALRRAALEKSWQRDRRVGRRRVAWRWMLWLLWRFGLPAAAVMVLAAAAVWAWRTVGPTPAPTPAASTPIAEPAPTLNDTPAGPSAGNPKLRMDWPTTPSEPPPASPPEPRPQTQGAAPR